MCELTWMRKNNARPELNFVQILLEGIDSLIYLSATGSISTKRKRPFLDLPTSFYPDRTSYLIKRVGIRKVKVEQSEQSLYILTQCQQCCLALATDIIEGN